jgi:hypothetical protein
MAFVYVQQILDLNLNAYVRYETLIPTSSPVASETIPVSTGVYDTSTHEVLTSYDDPTQSAGGGGGSGIMVWRPTATDSGNVYGSWTSLVAALVAANGTSTVVVDTSLVRTNIYPANAATIPVGAWNLRNVHFIGVPVNNGTVTERATLLLDRSGFAAAQNITFEDLQVNWETSATDLIGTTAGPVRITFKNVVLDSPSNTSTQSLLLVSGAAPTNTLEIVLDNFTQANTNTSTTVVTAEAGTQVNVYVHGHVQFSNTALFLADTVTTAWNLYVDTAADITNRASFTAAVTGTLTTVNRTESTNVQYSDVAAPAFGATNVQTALDAVKSQLANSSGERQLFILGGTATPGKNVYNSWSSLYAALSLFSGPKSVYFDALQNPTNKFTIPAGTYNLDGWTLFSAPVANDIDPPNEIILADGAYITGRSLTIQDLRVTTQAGSSATSPWLIPNTYKYTLILRGRTIFSGNGDAVLVRVPTGDTPSQLELYCYDKSSVGSANTISVTGGNLAAYMYDTSVLNATAVSSSSAASNAVVEIASPAAYASITAGAGWTLGTWTAGPTSVANFVVYNDALQVPLLEADNLQTAIDNLKNNALEATREPTGFPDRLRSFLSYTTLTRTVTISPSETTFEVYVRGRRFIKTEESITWPDVADLHIFYYDQNGVLSHQTGIASLPDIVANNALVSILYWANGTIVYRADERHGTTMDNITHVHMHLTLGTQWITGLGLTLTPDQSGNANSDAQVSIASGEIRDEDLAHTIANRPSQTLSPIASIPVLYRLGTSGVWNIKTPNTYPFIEPGTPGYAGTLPAYNQFTAGAWQLTQVANNDYFLAHIFATNDTNTPMFAIAGTSTYQTISSARTGALVEANALIVNELFAEFVIIGTIIYQASSSYANTPKARVRSTDDGGSYVDFRHRDALVAQPVTVHGNLSGLTADDHTQYLRTDGTRALTGNQSAGGNKITSLGTPTLATDAATKGYVDGLITPGGGIYRIAASCLYTVTGGFTSTDIVVGGFVYQPGTDTPIKMEAVGNFSGNFTLTLYDVGNPGSGGTTPVLRSTLNITPTSNYGSGVVTLTPNASPGVNANQISTSERFYEVRLNATSTGSLLWAGLKIGTSGS